MFTGVASVVGYAYDSGTSGFSAGYDNNMGFIVDTGDTNYATASGIRRVQVNPGAPDNYVFTYTNAPNTLYTSPFTY